MSSQVELRFRSISESLELCEEKLKEIDHVGTTKILNDVATKVATLMGENDDNGRFMLFYVRSSCNGFAFNNALLLRVT